MQSAQNTVIENPPQKKPNLVLYIILIITILAIASVIAYLKFFFTRQTSLPGQAKTQIAQPSKPLQTTAALSSTLPRFAEFREEKITVTPAIPPYTIKTDELSNLKAVEKDSSKIFSSGQLAAFSNPGFFTVPAENKLKNGDEEIDFHATADEYILLYKDIAGNSSPTDRKPENAVFITSDFLLHAYHVYLDRTFQYIEELKFQPTLSILSDMLFGKSLEEAKKASDEKIKDSYTRLAAFFLVPKVILEASKPLGDQYFQTPEEETKAAASDEEADKPEKILAKLETYKSTVPQKVYSKALEEIKLIIDAKEAAVSPLFKEFKKDQMDDYTQFKPRSHYAKNSALRSYFKAMIWYGRNGFLTKSDELTLDAINQTLMLNNLMKDGTKAIKLWEDIYLPTVFFVGKSDDLTVYDYSNLIDKIYGKNPGSENITDKDKFSQFKEEVKKLAGPEIQSSIVMVDTDITTKKEALEETKSFRFMGQRFIPDSFIFSTLTQGDEAPDPETGQKLPSIPTALMPMKIFGSSRASTHLETWITKSAPKSDKVLAQDIKKLEDAFSKLEVKDWTQNLYWSWLYTLKSLFNPFGQGCPAFMQNDVWADKDLYTSLGSWTELRHDTLLYAKQSYAELGAGMPDENLPPVPKGYVEPNLTFLNRIIALAEMTKEGLTNREVLPEEQKNKAEMLINTYKFYRDIAKKELANQKISDDDFEKLRNSASSLNYALTLPRGSTMKASEARAGLIADVHTAVTQDVKEILYEATGIPNIIYTAVKDANGTRVVRGLVYSYYEFTRPFGERLNDSDWQANIYEGRTDFSTPQVPDWVKLLQK